MNDIQVGAIYQIDSSGFKGNLFWTLEDDKVLLRSLYPTWPSIEALPVEIIEELDHRRYIVSPLNKTCQFVCSPRYLKPVSPLVVLAKQLEEE
jgi:hypothetical protein